MKLETIFVLAFLLVAGVATGQLANPVERTLRKDIDKQRWDRAKSRFQKALAKDSVNPSARYGLSLFFLYPDNPEHNLDSSYFYVVTALRDYTHVELRSKERLIRSGLDSLLFVRQRARIDSIAFEEARRIHTEAAYQEFLQHFPQAEQQVLARRLRDEVAYQDAVNENSYRAFQRYIERYPDSERADDARANYHSLLYEEKTRDQRLSSYIRFLEEHPDSPYRQEVYKQIFERSTADGNVERFISFMHRYPVSPLSRKAASMAFHILADTDHPEWPEGFLTDSLLHVLKLNETYWIPVYSNGRYGFMDAMGVEMLAPDFEEIDADYLCGGIVDDVLFVDGKLIGRNGGVIYDGKVERWDDLGLGLLLVDAGDTQRVIHKSGDLIIDSVDDARIIGSRFLSVRRENQWTLHALTGRQLDSRTWDDISMLQGLIVFRSGEKRFIAPPDALIVSGETLAVSVSEPFDELRPWMEGLLWGRSGEFEGVVDGDMNTVIRFDRHRLTEIASGAVARAGDKWVIYGRNGRRSSTLNGYVVAGRMVGGKYNGAWYALDQSSLQSVGLACDSLWAEGAFLVGYRRDSVVVHFEGLRARVFPHATRMLFIPGRDSTSFLAVQHRGRDYAVYDLRGDVVLAAAFDAIEYAGQGVFVVTQRDKKGLVDLQGKTLLPAEYDAIGSVRDGVISLLRNKRFGAYNVARRSLIKPRYDRNVVPYARDWAVCYRQGAYGFCRWDDREVSGLEFDEVQHWNDSIALVRRGGQWSFYDIAEGTYKAQGLRAVSPLRNTKGEKLAIVQRDKSYGVVDAQGDELIPATFSEVVNLGNPETPLFFTEKHIREASLFVVIYYDHTGKMLRKEIYDDVNDYDKIYCTVN